MQTDPFHLSNRIHSFKYLKSSSLGCKDIRIKKSEFVAKTHFRYIFNLVGKTGGSKFLVEQKLKLNLIYAAWRFEIAQNS